MKETIKQFKDGLFNQNPVLVLLLGMCPTLATSTSVENAFGMGIAATVVLVCSNTVISILRKVIPAKIRIAAFIVIIAGFVTAVDLVLQAFIPALSQSLGLFIPLIVVNCIILARAEAYASKNGVGRSALDGLTMGLGFTFALLLMSIIREILGNGTLMGFSLFPESFQPASIMAQPAGGFLTLGIIIAAMQKIMSRGGSKA